MKTDQLIVQYLYRNKKVTLQEIGTFTLSPEINIDPESDKDFALPPDAIRFDYNPKAEPDEDLIKYIMQHARKMKALAFADLESFIMLNKQFLNIGKPLIVEGLGTLEKMQAGGYAFTQANTSNVIREESPKEITEKKKEKISFITPPKEKINVNTKPVIGISTLLLLILASIAVYYYLNKKNKENDPQTNSLITAAPDTMLTKKTADIIPIVPGVKDSNTFYIVLNEYSNLTSAQKRMKVLSGYGHNIMLKTTDSITYKLKMPFRLPASDTLRIKDSLAKLLNPKAYVELP